VLTVVRLYTPDRDCWRFTYLSLNSVKEADLTAVPCPLRSWLIRHCAAWSLVQHPACKGNSLAYKTWEWDRCWKKDVSDRVMRRHIADNFVCVCVHKSVHKNVHMWPANVPFTLPYSVLLSAVLLGKPSLGAASASIKTSPRLSHPSRDVNPHFTK